MIDTINIKNFRPYKDTGDVRLTNLNAIIGKNDSGKSSILYAIDAFLNRDKVGILDINKGITGNEETAIRVVFKNPSGDFARRKLLNSSECLSLEKTYNSEGKRVSYKLQSYDFTDRDFQNLWSRKEHELNSLGDKYKLEFTKSGRSITNESKIEGLTSYAEDNGFEVDDIWIEVEGENKKLIEDSLPSFYFFHAEVSLETNESAFQKPFQEAIRDTLQQDNELKNRLETRVVESTRSMKSAIEKNLKEETNTVESIEIVSELEWQKLVSIHVDITDNLGLRIPLDNRGSGLKRLVMTSFLKYKSENSPESVQKSAIYGIEEPETSLHPSAQRVLLESLKKLAMNENQVIFTTHSPVFAGELEQNEIKLVKRSCEAATVISSTPATNEEFMMEIVDELGIRPRDLIVGYSALVFVEGPTDVAFFQEFWNKLVSKGEIDKSYSDLGIGFIPYGGDNLGFFVERRMLSKVNKKYAALTDSDKKSPEDVTPQKKVDLAEKVKRDGGNFIILRKREIENYVHPEAYKRLSFGEIEIGDFTDVKKSYFSGPNGSSKFIKVVDEMTLDEFLERDTYSVDGETKHELTDIIMKLAMLPE